MLEYFHPYLLLHFYLEDTHLPAASFLSFCFIQTLTGHTTLGNLFDWKEEQDSHIENCWSTQVKGVRSISVLSL